MPMFPSKIGAAAGLENALRDLFVFEEHFFTLEAAKVALLWRAFTGFEFDLQTQSETMTLSAV